VNNGEFENTATASGQPPVGDPVEDTDTVMTPSTQTPSISIDKLEPAGLLEEGVTLTYSFIVTNDGNVTLNPVVVDDPITNPVVCPQPSLAPEESMICTATYVVTQANVDDGEIDNTATVTGTPPTGDPVTDDDRFVVPIFRSPRISLEKASTTTEISDVGQIIPFTFLVTNTGNVTLDPILVTDPLTGPVSCPVAVLAPDASTTCTANYEASQDDVDAGVFSNTATATGQPPAGDPVMDMDTVMTPAPQGPAISLAKQQPTGSLAVDETITYAFLVTNVGNVTLTAVSVDDPTTNPVTCPATELAPGGSTICTATYVVTQDDVDNGEIVNRADVTGTPPIGDPVVDNDQITSVLDQTPQINLVKTTSNTLDAVDQVLSYSFTITNNGNVTLIDIELEDPVLATATCPLTELAPGQVMTCAGTYIVTQDDIDAGTLINTATVTGTAPDGTKVEDTDIESTVGQQLPAIDLDKQTPVGSLQVDAELTYFFVVTNTGNVTLTNIAIVDDTTGVVSCNATTLAPADSTTCSSVYTVTQDDVDAGQIVNTADVGGTPPSGPNVTSEDTEITPIEANPSIVLDKQDPTGVLAEGQTLTYPFVVTNTGNVTLTNVTVTDVTTGPVTCIPTTLPPAAQANCSSTYLVTQDDVDAGEILNEASVAGTPPTGLDVTAEDTVTSTIPQNPAITLDKTGPTEPLVLNAVVTYSFVVTNTGNVTLSAINIDDPLVGLVTCDVVTLAPGLSAACTGDYTITQTDIDNGEIVNTADVTGVAPDGTQVTDPAEVTTVIPQAPLITLDKETSGNDLVLDTVLPFTFEVTNTGTVTLTNITIEDVLTGPVTCSVTTLAPTESTTCTANYTVTQDDVNNAAFTNTATVSGLDPLGTSVSATDIDAVPGTPEPGIDIDKTAPAGPFTLGGIVDYEFVVTNTGNQTLTSVTVTDELAAPVTCPLDTLLPGDVMTCTASYEVDQDDVNTGTIPNTADVAGLSPVAEQVDDTDNAIVPVEQTPSILLDKQPPTGTLEAGQTVTYPFVVTNNGTVTLVNVRVNDPTVGAVTCDADVLAPTESTTCTANYTVTQDDVNSGSIVNTATALGDTASGSVESEDVETTPLLQTPAITLDKTGPAGPVLIGQNVNYGFVVKNVGNVTLDPVAVADPLADPVTCARTDLDPGESTICSATYVVTQANIDDGEVINVATATGVAPSGEIVDDDGTVTIPAAQRPAINLDKDAPTGVLAANATIAYTFTVTNIGTVTLTDVAVDDPLITPIACDVTTLAPGENANCSGIYVVSQSDVDDGEVINIATVTGLDPNDSPVQDDDTETITFDASPGLLFDKRPPVGDVVVDALLAWTFDVTNSGSVTLTNVAIQDSTVGPVSCASTSLAPGLSTTCTATSTVTQADVDAGEIVNVATATATDPGGLQLTATDQETIQIPGNPLISITKTTTATIVGLGDSVGFTLVVTNVGNVSLTNVIVTDPLAPVTCPQLGLAVGESMTCSAVMTVTQAMVDAGTLTNTANVDGLSPVGVVTTSAAAAVVAVDSVASISLVKSAPGGVLSVGDRVNFAFVVTNTGQVMLTNVVVDDPLVGVVNCPRSILEPAESMTCSASYGVTEADAAQGVVRNTATVTGTGPGGEQPTATDSTESPVNRPAPPVVQAAPSLPYPGPFASPAPVDPVAPAPPPLAQTGSGATPAFAIAMMLFVTGGVAVITVRRRDGHRAADKV